jgi:hypothetical protein
MTISDLEIEPPCSPPLKQISLPELRLVSIELFVGVAWLLCYFEDLQCTSQLEWFKISGRVRFTLNSSFPRVTALRQWLILNKSKLYIFQLKMTTDFVLGAQEIRDTILTDSRRATGGEFSWKCRNLHIRYPEMSFSNPSFIECRTRHFTYVSIGNSLFHCKRLELFS